MKVEEMAKKIQEARDTVKRLKGQEYEATVREHRRVLGIEMKQKKCDPIRALLSLNGRLELSGVDALLFLAACADECDQKGTNHE